MIPSGTGSSINRDIVPLIVIILILYRFNIIAGIVRTSIIAGIVRTRTISLSYKLYIEMRGERWANHNKTFDYYSANRVENY
jgi:hypothetical protein